MRKPARGILCLLLIAALLLTGCGQKATGKLTITCFNIPEFFASGDKSGDMTLVQLPDGKTLLIDAGIREASPYLTEYLHDMGVKKLDYVMLTHPHSDHWGGFVGPKDESNGILDNFKVGEILIGAFSESNAPAFYEKVAEKNIPIRIVGRGDTFELGGVQCEIFNPGDDDDLVSDATNVVNNSSIVMRMVYKNNTALFTGDLYSKQELKLAGLFGDRLKTQFLKIPHHGYDTSSTQQWVDAVQPEIAVAEGGIEMGVFQYRRYRKAGTDVYITYLDGTVTVIGDGETFTITHTLERSEETLRTYN